jgi:RHS repeat-associated protein
VLVTISDKKIGVMGGGEEYDHWEPEIITANDYYPFGMGMPGRKYYQDDSYRYGFNGKENDNDVKGDGNQQDYGMRVYDPRLGKFLSVDPLTGSYPWNSPYAYAENEPISNIDLDGLEKVKSTSSGVSAGVDQYFQEKMSQGRGITRYFKSWTPYKKAWNFGKDWVKGATGDEAAMKRASDKTVKAVNDFANNIYHTVCDPINFVMTMDQRSSYENVKGLTFFALKAAEIFLIFRAGGEIEGGTFSELRTAQISNGNYLNKIFKSPMGDPRAFLRNSGVESFTFVEGTNSAKTAVIGQGMDRVKTVANGLVNAEVFSPSAEALAEWNTLLEQNPGKTLADDVIKSTKMFKENVSWIQGVKKAGYNIIDIRVRLSGESTSTFYNMEKETVYGSNK